MTNHYHSYISLVNYGEGVVVYEVNGFNSRLLVFWNKIVVREARITNVNGDNLEFWRFQIGLDVEFGPIVT